jgi:hypothetical protein
MPSPQKKPAKAKPLKPDASNLDLDPDAWGRFEALVKSAAKMGHKPHAAKPTKNGKSTKPA